MRTTIIAEDHLLLELKTLAEQRGESLSAIIQEAFSQYLGKHKKRKKISFTAIGSSHHPSPIARDTDRVISRLVNEKKGF